MKSHAGIVPLKAAICDDPTHLPVHIRDHLGVIRIERKRTRTLIMRHCVGEFSLPVKSKSQILVRPRVIRS